jgi:hypothetical protein
MERPPNPDLNIEIDGQNWSFHLGVDVEDARHAAESTDV